MDLAMLAVGGDVEHASIESMRRLHEPPNLPPLRPAHFLRRPGVPPPALIARSVLRLWRVDPIEALLSWLPDGVVDLRGHFEDLDQILGAAWPNEELWLCAVRQHDHRRVVFGRDGEVPLSDAVAASCCVPAYFAPIGIDGATYIDGGVRSPTNADVVRQREDLDLAIIVSPMSGRDLGRLGVSNLMRRHARAKLTAERATLRRSGIPSVVIEPDRAVVDAIGDDFSTEHLRAIMRSAFLDTGDLLRSPFVRTLLAGLNNRLRSNAVAATA